MYMYTITPTYCRRFLNTTSGFSHSCNVHYSWWSPTWTITNTCTTKSTFGLILRVLCNCDISGGNFICTSDGLSTLLCILVYWIEQVPEEARRRYNLLVCWLVFQCIFSEFISKHGTILKQSCTGEVRNKLKQILFSLWVKCHEFTNR